MHLKRELKEEAASTIAKRLGMHASKKRIERLENLSRPVSDYINMNLKRELKVFDCSGYAVHRKHCHASKKRIES